MNIFFIAEGEIEGIIWLVVIIFWGIGQLLNAIKNSREKSGGNPERRSPSDAKQGKGPSTPEGLPDFLERIFGSQKIKAPPPPKPHVKLAGKPKPVAPSKLMTKANTKRREKAKQIKLRRDAEQANAFGTESEKSSLGIQSFKLPSTGTQLSNSAIKRIPRISLNLRNDANFKRAILARTIIGPPKALEDDQFLNRNA